MLGAGNLQKKWTIAARYVDTDLDRPRWRITLDYRVNERFIYGIEYNPAANELNPFRATYDAVLETEKSPMVSFGVSSDRIGTDKGNLMYYVTVAKNIRDTPISPYVGLAYSEQDKGFNVPFGANIALSEEWSLMPMFDGRRGHMMLNYKQPDYWISAGWIWFERIGIAVGFGF